MSTEYSDGSPFDGYNPYRCSRCNGKHVIMSYGAERLCKDCVIRQSAKDSRLQVVVDSIKYEEQNP